MRGTKKAVFAAIFALALILCGCGGASNRAAGTAYEIYYVNNEETRLVAKEYVSATTDETALLEELLGQLSAIPERMEYQAPLEKEFSLLGHSLEGDLLTLDFDEAYKELRGTREVLVRASIVRTLTQIPTLGRVAFTVKGEQLVDQEGKAIGVMARDTFIENAGNEINAYEKVDLRLYFANGSGKQLVEENRRNVVYSSNISLEKLVVEKLIEGPLAEGVYPTVNPATKVMGVTVKDGICYVNLNSDFLTQPYNVAPNVTVYSITNSLVELPNVNKVQISVDGKTDISYREKVSLNNVFERNLDILVK